MKFSTIAPDAASSALPSASIYPERGERKRMTQEAMNQLAADLAKTHRLLDRLNANTDAFAERLEKFDRNLAAYEAKFCKGGA